MWTTTASGGAPENPVRGGRLPAAQDDSYLAVVFDFGQLFP